MEQNSVYYCVLASNLKVCAETIQRFRTETGLDFDEKNATNLTNTAQTLEVSAGTEAHIFSPLPAGLKSIVISKQMPMLLANDFTLAWLDALLQQTIPDGAIYLENVPEKRVGVGRRLFLELLKSNDVNFSVELVTAGWHKIQKIDKHNRLEPSFSTVFNALYNQFDEFQRRYSEAHEKYIDPDRLKPEMATRQFTYTMHGMTQKSIFLEELIDRSFGHDKSIRILDMGGGYGAMGAEMAAKGHKVTVLEMEGAKIEWIGKWISQKADLEHNLDFVEGTFDHVFNMDEKYDAITFFGSLLYYPREQINALLQACASRLTKGGVLVVHETPKELAKPEALDYSRQFTGPELNEILLHVFDNVNYYSIFSHADISLDKASNTVLMAVAKRD